MNGIFVIGSHLLNPLSVFLCSRKDAKKVQKLEAQIPYHEGRGNKDEAAKLREQIEDIWSKARQAAAF